LLLLAPFPAVAASSPPPAAILKLTNAIIEGTTRDDVSAFAGLFPDDATVVDENEPFVWRGAGAGVAWWHAVDQVTRKAPIIYCTDGGKKNVYRVAAPSLVALAVVVFLTIVIAAGIGYDTTRT